MSIENLPNTKRRGGIMAAALIGVSESRVEQHRLESCLYSEAAIKHRMSSKKAEYKMKTSALIGALKFYRPFGKL